MSLNRVENFGTFPRYSRRMTPETLAQHPHDDVELAAALQREVEAAEAALVTAVQHALNIGDMLIAKKATLQHGEWIPWLESNFCRTRQHAATYMRLARADRTQMESAPSIQAAIKMLTPQRSLELTVGSARVGLIVEDDDEVEGETTPPAPDTGRAESPGEEEARRQRLSSRPHINT